MKGEFSSKWACRNILTELERECVQVLNGRHLIGVEIMGTDSFVHIFDKVINENNSETGKAALQSRTICCLLRPGVDNETYVKHIQDVIEPAISNLGVNLILLDSNIFAFPLQNVSSSAIRKLVSKGDWETLRLKGWLHPNVLKALQQKR